MKNSNFSEIKQDLSTFELISYIAVVDSFEGTSMSLGNVSYTLSSTPFLNINEVLNIENGPLDILFKNISFNEIELNSMTPLFFVADINYENMKIYV